MVKTLITFKLKLQNENETFNFQFREYLLPDFSICLLYECSFTCLLQMATLWNTLQIRSRNLQFWHLSLFILYFYIHYYWFTFQYLPLIVTWTDIMWKQEYSLQTQYKLLSTCLQTLKMLFHFCLLIGAYSKRSCLNRLCCENMHT